MLLQRKKIGLEEQEMVHDNVNWLLTKRCIELFLNLYLALGTLYAFSKAAAVALKTFKVDILSDLKEGKISVGLYHTAGKGTRLAPLPGAENNNKPGVKLPATTIVAGKSVPMTILEAVIKQTG